MAKKYALLFIVAVLIVVIVSFSVSNTGSSLVVAQNQEDGVVDKAAGDDFKVTITFQNTGKTEGTWNINIAFEGEVWSQIGKPQNLTLGSGQTETLTWNGVVPANATTDSMARLVVYYNDCFKALCWWIHVVPGAELTIESSSVE